MRTLSAPPSEQVTIQDVLNQLRAQPLWANVVREEVIPARPARFAPFPERLRPEVVDVLRERGFDRLYTHQAEAIEAGLGGENVAIVTPTASGKTLCYNIPVVQRIVENPESRALYLFPTKALSHDQYAGVYDLTQALGRDIKVFTYDGDTPGPARTAIRNAAHIVVTNPDMLHSGILPHHTKWIKLFENLETVVIDEMHQYRGVFGSHMGNVIRRLRRICEFYGSKPKFVCCSATIANPREMAETLVEEKFRLIDNNGAPSGERVFIFYNPPVVNQELGIRASSVKEVRRLAAEFIARGLQTIVFARSRNRVEILGKYLRRELQRRGGDPNLIRAYRGGYLPNERREIERGIREGEIRGVVSTNALELGIDIGSLQVAVLTGYPGTIASAWQQAGRAGRQQQTAVTILVANSSPLDQYLMTKSDYFFGASPEHGILNPDNVAIMASHLRCALHEIPIEDGEKFGASYPGAFLEHFESQQMARRTGNKTYWASDAYPAEDVSLRTATPQNFIVHDTTNGNRVLAEIDYDSAQFLIHEHAIYIHQGRTYYVDQLDWDRRRAYVRLGKFDYYTEAVAKSDLKVLQVDEEEAPGETTSSQSAPNLLLSKCFGEVSVSTTVPKFKKIKLETHESIGYGEILLPQADVQTQCAWWMFRDEAEESLAAKGLNLGNGLKGLAWVLHKIVPLYVMCDPRDVATHAMVHAPSCEGRPTIFLYDRVPGGIGLARRAFGMDRQILRAALELVSGCACSEGCPSCVGPAKETGEVAKRAARNLLMGMVG